MHSATELFTLQKRRRVLRKMSAGSGYSGESTCICVVFVLLPYSEYVLYVNTCACKYIYIGCVSHQSGLLHDRSSFSIARALTRQNGKTTQPKRRTDNCEVALCFVAVDFNGKTKHTQQLDNGQ